MNAEALFEKALLAIKDRNQERALWLLTEAIKKDPEHAEAWTIRGNVTHAQGRYFDSLLHYDRAVAINPNAHDAWCNRGIAFSDIGMWDSAEECFRCSLELCPAVEPHLNLANMLCHTMQLDRAEAEYRAAVEMDPGHYEARINLGLTLLGQGKWTKGWPEYHWRHLNTPHPPLARRVAPEWAGEPIDGKTILLWPEQGYGDEIMFMRFAATVAALGAKVILQARPALVELARTVPGIERVISRDEPIPPIDLQLALMDVPMILGIGADAVSFPPYLRSSPAPWLGHSLPEGFRVGLCWNSGHRPLQPETEASYKTKSIFLEWLQPLAQEGVALVSLQKEHKDHATMKRLDIFDMMPDVHSFSETAQLIAHCDLVISVDTAVAHLAGALGKPVWNFVRFSGYWPWLRDAGKTRWYPSMKVYRQPALGDWNDPINRAAADLRALVAARQQEAAE